MTEAARRHWFMALHRHLSEDVAGEHDQDEHERRARFLLGHLGAVAPRDSRVAEDFEAALRSGEGEAGEAASRSSA